MEQTQTHLSLLAFLLVLPLLQYVHGAVLLDIRKFGTPGGDITAALDKAWKEAVVSPKPTKITIPAGKWQLKQARLEGPSAAPITLEVLGTITALPDPHHLPDKKGEWITINYLNFFTLSGNGVFDGNGKVAWTLNDCHKNRNCMKLPINLSFNFLNNSIIQDVTTKDSKNFHVNCISSNNVTFQRFKISAPAESPNTDGIHLGRDNGIKILDSIIETGDDCISMGDDLTDVLIKSTRCGPGHGISIGSLGRDPTEKDVSRITVQNCTFKNSDNGVRVKTWPSAPAKLTISDLSFLDLNMINVSNPVIIDQQYCPWNMCSLDKASLIQISKVKIQNVRGTSATQDVVIFACSTSKPCQDVQIGNIDLTFIGDPALGGATTKCQNVKYTFTGGKQIPQLCAKSAAPRPLPGLEIPSIGESKPEPEKKSEKTPEKKIEKPEKKSEKTPEKKIEKPEKKSEKKPEKAEKKSEKKPEKKSEKKSEKGKQESKKQPEKKADSSGHEKKGGGKEKKVQEL